MTRNETCGKGATRTICFVKVRRAQPCCEITWRFLKPQQKFRCPPPPPPPLLLSTPPTIMAYFFRSGFNLENHIVCFVCFRTPLHVSIAGPTQGPRHLQQRGQALGQERRHDQGGARVVRFVDERRQGRGRLPTLASRRQSSLHVLERAHQCGKDDAPVCLFVCLLAFSLFFTLTPQEVLGDVVQ